MIFKPRGLKFSVNKEFRWLGHLFFPGIFDGEHIFELIEVDNNSTRFIQRENFSGILVPFLWKQLNTKTRKGFELMNDKIKEMAEKS
ncbi:SRPBCC domain-containing protein [Bacteroidota bacterium]